MIGNSFLDEDCRELHFINLIHAYKRFARTCRVVNFDYEINSFVVLISCGMDLTNLH